MSGVAFSALRHPEFRGLAATSLLSMMADNVEHVISYWLIYQAFHSAALAGFAVVSHWMPFLLLSVYIGGLADRHDCRKIMVLSQVAFISVSFVWAVLFLTGALEPWHAMILLVIHGVAGALLTAARQLIIYDVVGPSQLQSAVRLTSTSTQLGILFGPAVGGALLLLVGPAYGLLVNCLIYLPMIGWAIRVPHTGHLRSAAEGIRASRLTFGEAIRTLRAVSANRDVVVMIALAGASSFLVGNAYQAQMPEFADAFGSGGGELSYSMLLAANAAGAVLGGILLESSRVLRRAQTRTAIALALGWCASLIIFAVAPTLFVAVVALFTGGILNIGFTSMAQTLVQLEAPSDRRGQVTGVFNMASPGLRAGSGLTIGIFGTLVGIHVSLALSAMVLTVICGALLLRATSAVTLARQP